MQFIKLTERFTQKPTIINVEHISRVGIAGDAGAIVTMVLPGANGAWKSVNIQVIESVYVVSEAILSIQEREDALRQRKGGAL